MLWRHRLDLSSRPAARTVGVLLRQQLVAVDELQLGAHPGGNTFEK